MRSNKICAILLATVMVLSVMTALGGTAAASHGSNTIVVDDDGGEDFQSIQAAVDHANDGDTIEVLPGSYDGVVVDKNVSLIGEDPDVTTIEGGSGNAILLSGHQTPPNQGPPGHPALLSDIHIEGFTLQSDEGAGVAALSDGNTDFDTRNLTISNVVVENSTYGIFFFDAQNVKITDSEINGSEGNAIAMTGVDDVEIARNTITNNGEAGVSVGANPNPDRYPDNSGDILVNRNNIEGNDIGVFNGDESLTVDATENYWGHASGPGGEDGRTNPAGKEVGQGDDIEGDVDFDPWLRQPTSSPASQ